MTSSLKRDVKRLKLLLKERENIDNEIGEIFEQNSTPCWCSSGSVADGSDCLGQHFKSHDECDGTGRIYHREIKKVMGRR